MYLHPDVVPGLTTQQGAGLWGGEKLVGGGEVGLMDKECSPAAVSL